MLLEARNVAAAHVPEARKMSPDIAGTSSFAMSGTHEFGGTRIEAGRPLCLAAVIADLLLRTHDGRRCSDPVPGMPVAPHEGALLGASDPDGAQHTSIRIHKTRVLY
jgi:hypothetical protein